MFLPLLWMRIQALFCGDTYNFVQENEWKMADLTLEKYLRQYLGVFSR